MKDLIECIKKKWFCLHDWEYFKGIRVENNLGEVYHVWHFYCKKCGKFKKIKSV